MTAIITDVHYRMSLAMIRDLAERGVTVICCEIDSVIERGMPALGFFSKHCASSHILSADRYEEDLFDLCRSVAERQSSRPALLPVGSGTLDLLCDPAVRARFEAVCGLAIPTDRQRALFNDKAAVRARAAALGVPVPRDFGAGERVDFPCVVKPRCGEAFGLSAGERYRIVEDEEQLEKALRHFSETTGEMPLVQEYLPGAGLGCSVLAHRGKITAAIAHRRIREYPVTGGPSSCCRRIDPDSLGEYAARLVEDAGYSGLAMFEFKEDADGKPRLLEINPRVWGTFPLSRVCRFSVAYAWFLCAWSEGNGVRGSDAEFFLRRDSGSYSRMIFSPTDLFAGIGYLKRGQPLRLLASVLDFLNPLVRDGLWEWRDPRPGLAYYASLLRRGNKSKRTKGEV